jgi:TM2 domain-containing membrane protein YozV
VLLSFIVLGGGQLYVGQIAIGVLLIMLDAFLWLISLTVFGAIVSVPVWATIFTISAIASAFSVKTWNRRRGLSSN